MKKFLIRFWALILAAALTAVLSAVSLARPEAAAPEEDRFVGFHLVWERMPGDMNDILNDPDAHEALDRSNWVEYGSVRAEAEGIGSITLPREVLFGVFDEANYSYDFPGLDGYNLFFFDGFDKGGNHYNSVCSDLLDGDFRIGNETSISGTLYVEEGRFGQEGEGVPGWAWTAYRVYQTPDGRIYLDGSGNSYAGAGGMSFSESATYTETENGEETESSTLTVEVRIETHPRMDTLTVTQYDGTDQPLTTRTYTPAELETNPELTLDRRTAWTLVTQRNGDGTAFRTVYDREETEDQDAVVHQVVLFDENGGGYGAFLTLNAG